MENKEFKSASEFIQFGYEHYYGSLDKTNFPQSIMDNFDTKSFSLICLNKDFYDIIMNSNPFSDVESFINYLEANDKNNVSNFSFAKTLALIDKYELVAKQIFESALETLQKESSDLDSNNEKDSAKDLVEISYLEITNYIDLQYKEETGRIISKLNQAVEIGNKIISSINGSVKQSDVDSMKAILSELKDKSNVMPETLLDNAVATFKQTQMFEMNDNVINKMKSQYE